MADAPEEPKDPLTGDDDAQAKRMRFEYNPEAMHASWKAGAAGDVDVVEIQPLNRARLHTMAQAVMEALHQQRAAQTVDYQMAQPLAGKGKATAIVFLPPSFGELDTIRNAVTVIARSEDRAIIDGMAPVVSAATKDKSEDVSKAIIEAFAALEKAIHRRWRADAEQNYRLAE